MKIRTLLFFILIAASVFAQPKIPEFLYSEVKIFPRDSLYNLCFTYKIPYNRLVFEKKNGEYSAGVQASLEIKTAENGFIARDIKEKRVWADDFDQTNSDDLYIEGLLSFTVAKGEYELLPVFSDLNTQQEIKLPPVEASVSDSVKNVQALIVKNETAVCEDNEYRVFGNFNGSIPFGKEDYEIIVPVKEPHEEMSVVVVNNGIDTVYSEKLSGLLPGEFFLKDCDEKIVLDIKESEKTGYFILKDISRKLKEGIFTILVSEKGRAEPVDTVKAAVKWYKKPYSLLEPETAVKFLKYIEPDSLIKRLLKNDEMKLYEALFDYWKKTDPTPETEYNELMEEYYTRLDYVQSNFSMLTGKNGTDTDRGKVYIQFGRPQKIERTSNEYGKVVETWIYNNPQRKFIFVDKNGIGEFSLQKG